MAVKEGEAATPEQEAYERGRQLYVKDSLELACQLNGGPLSEESVERIVSNANTLYATKYTTDLCGAMTGKTIVGASELIPGMHGINKAWMGVVNHMRGDLSDGQLADEILGGIHSALTDAAFCVATAGAAHYYRSAKMVVGAAKEAAKVGGEGAKKSVRFVDEGAQLELSHNVGSRQAFDRKLGALQDLADRGKLFKSANVARDESVTFAYRKNILMQAQKQWGVTEPARVQRIEQALKTRLHADHLHELQLGGVDHGSALSLLDKQVNMSVGSQVMHQLKDVPVGTKIISIIEKASK